MKKEKIQILKKPKDKLEIVQRKNNPYLKQFQQYLWNMKGEIGGKQKIRENRKYRNTGNKGKQANWKNRENDDNGKNRKFTENRENVGKGKNRVNMDLRKKGQTSILVTFDSK